MSLMEKLEHIETLLDDLSMRAGETNSREHEEYMLSGIRTIKHELYQAMREVSDHPGFDADGNRRTLTADHEPILPAPGITNVPADQCGECGAAAEYHYD